MFGVVANTVRGCNAMQSGMKGKKKVVAIKGKGLRPSTLILESKAALFFSSPFLLSEGPTVFYSAPISRISGVLLQALRGGHTSRFQGPSNGPSGECQKDMPSTFFVFSFDFELEL